MESKVLIEAKIEILKKFRTDLKLLCERYGYTGVIFNVIWNGDFRQLLDPATGKITAMNNTIRMKRGEGVKIRPMTKDDVAQDIQDLTKEEGEIVKEIDITPKKDGE